jgi:hypothetical protein
MKPPKLGTVWTAAARIRAIVEHADGYRWETLATCIDTPNAIAAVLLELRRRHPGKTLWVKSDTKGEYIP